MFVRAAALPVNEEQKRQLELVARAGATPQKTARRCQVILLERVATQSKNSNEPSMHGLPVGTIGPRPSYGKLLRTLSSTRCAVVKN
jgi:hypothetical protein